MTLQKTLKIVGCVSAVIFILSLAGCQNAIAVKAGFHPADGSTLAAGDALGQRCYPSMSVDGDRRMTSAGSLSSVDTTW